MFFVCFLFPISYVFYMFSFSYFILFCMFFFLFHMCFHTFSFLISYAFICFSCNFLYFLIFLFCTSANGLLCLQALADCCNYIRHRVCYSSHSNCKTDSDYFYCVRHTFSHCLPPCPISPTPSQPNHLEMPLLRQPSPAPCHLPPPTPSQAHSLKMALLRQPTPMLSPVLCCLMLLRWPSPMPTPPLSLCCLLHAWGNKYIILHSYKTYSMYNNIAIQHKKENKNKKKQKECMSK